VNRQAPAAPKRWVLSPRSAHGGHNSHGYVVGVHARWLGAAISILALVVIAGLAAAQAAEPVAPEYRGSFGPDGTDLTNFQKVSAVAADQQTGAVYALDEDAGALYKFNLDGQAQNFGGSAPNISGNRLDGLSPLPGGNQVAVNSDTHTVYVTNAHGLLALTSDGEPADFTAGPSAGTDELGGFGHVRGVAVDPNGAIYVADQEAGTVSIFASSGELLTVFAAANPAGLAVAPSGTLYVNSWNRQVEQFIPSEFPVTSSTVYTAAAEPIEPNNTNAIALDPGTGKLYLLQGYPGNFAYTHIVVVDENGTFIETFAEPGEEGELINGAHGLAVYSPSGRIFAAADDNIAGVVSQVKVYGPEELHPGPPSILDESAAEVTSQSAQLEAQLNPNTFSTAYRFEYGPADCDANPCVSVPAGGAVVGAGHVPISVQQDIVGLSPGTVYHYRVVASNAAGTTVGSDRRFTTQPAALGSQLPDDRAWEMVSPPSKHGAKLIGSQVGLIQAAADGSGLAYLSVGSIEENPEGSRTFEPSSILARRTGSGWRSSDITPPNEHVVPIAIGRQGEYQLFDQNLSRSLLTPRSGMLLSEAASERTPYLRENTDPPSYIPLLTGKEGFADVAPGTQFGGDESSPVGPVRVSGASRDLRTIALDSAVPLLSGAPSRGEYTWSNGQLRPLSVLPGSEGGEFVGPAVIGSGEGSMRNAISPDGSRIVWSRGQYGSGDKAEALTGLYMRNTDREESVRIDLPEAGVTGSAPPRPIFQGASVDGGVILFTDKERLTEDASPSGADLYRCQVPLGDVASGCATLDDLTAATQAAGESANVLRLVAGMSADGDAVYFTAEGVLDATPNGDGGSAIAGHPNLYLWQQGEGVRFIARLSVKDKPDWGAGVGQQQSLATAVSPNGRYLAFMSERSLTGYDNRDTASEEPLQEVFRYDAVTDGLDCISCNPSGATPTGAFNTLERQAPVVDPQATWWNHWLAAALPQPTTSEVSGLSIYQPRTVLDSGRVFFNAIDSLVAADSNGAWDVYEYEPTETGSCTDASDSSAIARTAAGCVALLSSGTAEGESGFLDASESGDDVFFLSLGQLNEPDVDHQYDVYDARVDGVPAKLPVITECLGEACQGAPEIPTPLTPASGAFMGAGNVHHGRHRKCRPGKRTVHHNGKARCARHHRRAHQKKGVKR
jgi:hypothetical protein